MNLAVEGASNSQTFHEKGYLVLRGLFTEEEVAAWSAESDRLVGLSDLIHEDNLRVGFRTNREGERYIEKFDPLVDISPVFEALARDERILTPLREIYNDDALLFKDKLIFKWPGVAGYTMHQDAAMWQPFPFETLISVMVAIDGADESNGGLELFARYHDRLLSTPGEIRNMNEEERKLVTGPGELVETSPGDVILFHALTPHQSGYNTSDRTRRQLYLTYNPAKHGNLYDAHYDHFRTYATRHLSDEAKQKKFFR